MPDPAGRDGTQPGEPGQPIRDAATIVLLRGGPEGPAVLMGQRGRAAAFMPEKFVFPGGAVDPADALVSLASDPADSCAARLAQAPRPGDPRAIAAAAIRELWEEAGLILGRRGTWPANPPEGWGTFAATGHRPDAGALRFVFRAITPPGRTRRFDARFFLADAGAVAGDPDDFARASDELGHLAWVPIDRARQLNLPFVTEIVLAEIAAQVRSPARDGPVPFFDNSGATPAFRWIA
jgi:8-oxo-dGTP pyrophosphatase MutT (NUDIX family)